MLRSMARWCDAASVCALLLVLLTCACDDSATGPDRTEDESVPFSVQLATATDVEQGTRCPIDVTMQEANARLLGFDMRIAYNAAALALLDVHPGDIAHGGWEYLSFHRNPLPCGDEAPTGIVVITGLADDPAIVGDPDWMYLDTVSTPFTLFTLDFLVTNDRTYEGGAEPIRFCWCECDDNTLTFTDNDRPTSEMIGLAREVTDVAYAGWPTDGDSQSSRTDGPPDSCFRKPSGNQLLAAVDFKHGGLSIAAADSVDTRCPPGDVNCDGEVATQEDYELFREYFCAGEGVFAINRLTQIANTDFCPGHGPLTMADLLTLKSIIDDGPRPIIMVHTDSVQYTIESGSGLFRLHDTVTALYIEYTDPTYVPVESDDPPVRVCNYNDTCRVFIGDPDNPMDLSGEMVRIGGRLTKLDAATEPYRNVELVPGITPQ